MRLAARCHAQRDFSPVSWSHYFDEAHDVQLIRNEPGAREPDSFRVYLNNFRPPYAPERRNDQERPTDDTISESEFRQYDQWPTLVLLHGGGYSALTWAPFTHCIERECHCRILAIDLRAHGDTKTGADDKMNMETLVDDVVQVVHATHQKCGFNRTPKLILVGHSMGGAIAIKCASGCLDTMPTLAGMVIIDVVEGTAKDALPLMMSVIKTRPNKFPSVENAIEWSFRSGMTKNLEAARVSMPGNLVNVTSEHLAIHDIVESAHRTDGIAKHKYHISIENLIGSHGGVSAHRSGGLGPLPARVACLRQQSGFPRLSEGPGASLTGPLANATTSITTSGGREGGSGPIDEADENEDESKPTLDASDEQAGPVDSEGYRRPPSLDQSGYCWRTDLAKTQPHWPGWFEGLSQQMLDAPVQGKFLLLAGIDRLDKTLTIGQMQGKFMMKVLPKCGHAVHEDSPERVAGEIAQFLVRNKFTKAADTTSATIPTAAAAADTELQLVK